MDIEPIYDFLCCVHTWWLNGQLHRIDGPAFEDNNEKRWYTEGKLHRLDGPAIIAGNYMEWRRDGLRHRGDGPSLIMDNGRREWWFNSQLHCGSGPAVIWSTGFLEWWINGIQLNATLVEQWMKLKDISWPFDEETEAEFLLTWA